MEDKYKTYLRQLIKNEITEKDYTKQIDEFEDKLLENMKPFVFNMNNPNSVLIKMNKDFKKSCQRLTKHSGISNVNKLSVFDYEVLVEDVKEQNK